MNPKQDKYILRDRELPFFTAGSAELIGYAIINSNQQHTLYSVGFSPNAVAFVEKNIYRAQEEIANKERRSTLRRHKFWYINQ